MTQLAKSLTPAEYKKLVNPLRLSERQVVKAVTDLLKAEGWTCIRLQSGTVRGHTQGTFIKLCAPGTPDWIVVRGKPARDYFFFEAKAPGKKLSIAQQQWHSWAYHYQLPVIVADGLATFLSQFRERFK